MTTEKAKKFWARVRVGAPSACWPWTGQHTAGGHGKVSWYGEPTYAHRVAWTLTNGALKRGERVLHTDACKMTDCCNPSHLMKVSGRRTKRRKANQKTAAMTPAALASLRDSVSATQEQFASAMGYSVSSLRRMEAGETTITGRMKALAEAAVAKLGGTSSESASKRTSLGKGA